MPRYRVFKVGTEPPGWAPAGKKRVGSTLVANPKRKKRSTRPAPEAIWDQRDDSIASAEAGREWTDQFYQGKSIMDLSGVGCGFYTMGSPWVPSQHPSPKETRLELMTGTDGDRGGSIKLYGPRHYWGSGECSDACFLVPAAHIEQVIVLPQHPTLTKNKQYHQVIIVPTAATGISTIKRKYPQIISFSWPDKKVDKRLEGKIGEAADPKEDTYLSVFKRAGNDQLAHYKKSVMDLTGEEQQGFLYCNATLSHTTETSDEKVLTPGHIYFLDTGLLFLSDSTRVYLPLMSMSKVLSVIMRDIARARSSNKESEPVCLNIYMRVGEPFFESKASDENGSSSGGPQAKPTTLLLGFTDIPLDRVEEVEQFMEKRGVKFRKCEQRFYDFDKNQPLGGFDDRRT
ncbi:hypothetical protein QBC47DRAFT_395303 [Echria macrotheca]|uniref:Uncharacterized protein n=1 Tax=Echria macrotheca TaxID=438768 RepID=A0AAJ0B5J7_9PEZI|nr:hypothetical protein QBC47DRAFT_395303 [Echria macrotheca]